jgi:uncharacterized membrane protein (DUF485 family)
MGLNSRWYKTIAISTLVFDILFMFGIMGSFFNGLTITSNLFNTGVTPGFVLGLANIFVVWSIYKNNI